MGAKDTNGDAVLPASGIAKGQDYWKQGVQGLVTSPILYSKWPTVGTGP